MTKVAIPQMGVSSDEGELSEWLVADGDTVQTGDIIYVLETDKAANEIPAPATGTIRITGEEGVTYAIGTVVATIE